MSAGVSTALVGLTSKQKAEAANFQAFRVALPNFAGPLASIEWGADPPDVLSVGASGDRIGVELVQWINQRQIADSKKRYKLEDSYTLVIQSESVEAPPNIGMIFIYVKIPLAPNNAAVFRKELYEFIAAVEAKYPEWDDPQGYMFTDFSAYPCLAAHLEGLDVYSTRGRSRFPLGVRWIVFRNHGGAYTPDWMRDALLGNIKRKIDKYAKPHNKQKLEQQRLTEFCL